MTNKELKVGEKEMELCTLRYDLHCLKTEYLEELRKLENHIAVAELELELEKAS